MNEPFLTIDLGEKEVRIVDAQVHNGEITVSSLACQQETPLFYRFPSEKVIKEEILVLEKLIKNMKTNKKIAHVIIPDGVTYSQILEMPILKEKELLSAVKYQADQFIPMPLEEAAIDLEILYEDNISKKMLVLIVAAPQKIITQVTQLIEAAGLVPEVIENELAASGRLISQIYKPHTQNSGTIFVNIGFSSSTLYFFHNSVGIYIENHTFQVGLDLFVKELRVNMEADVKKSRELLKNVGLSPIGSTNIQEMLTPVMGEFLKEVDKFIFSVKNRYKLVVTNLALFNNASEIRGLDKQLEKSFAIPSFLLDLRPYLKKNSFSETYKLELSPFVSAVGGCTQ